VPVLVVEDALDRVKRFKGWLPAARIVASASRAIAAIRKDVPEIIFLDRDLIASFGEEVAEFLTAQKFAGQVYITSANPFGVELISKILREGAVNFQIAPFAMLGVVRVPRETVEAEENG
jgi:response regulator of citrate/malate metabolism